MEAASEAAKRGRRWQLRLQNQEFDFGIFADLESELNFECFPSSAHEESSPREGNCAAESNDEMQTCSLQM